MYTAIFSFAAALISCISMVSFGTPASTAGGFFIGATAVGMAADAVHAKRRAAAK